MNNSNYIYKLNRTLYIYHNKHSRIIHSRLVTLLKNTLVLLKRPVVIGRKSIKLLVNNPKKFFRILAGKVAVADQSSAIEGLVSEYEEWINKNENVDVEEQVRLSKEFTKQPLITLITPVFNPPAKEHNKLIESVIGQTYGNFELLLFNFGDNAEVKELLDEWANKDSRIIVKHDLPNEGISKNSNLCLKYAKGEYIGLLDHDDELAVNALFECVEAINNTGAEFIYSDKDKITEEDERHEPLFKPDLSPEMLLGGNYLTHFNLMKTKIVRDIGGWDSTTDGAQDWDIFLRMLDVTNKVAHIPKILYHWRTVAGSTANGVSVKPYALKAQVRTVDKHLLKHGEDAVAVQDATGQTYVEWGYQIDKCIYLVHLAYTDMLNAQSFLKKIKRTTHFNNNASIVIIYPARMFRTEHIEKHTKKLLEIYKNIEFVEYEIGNFVKAVIEFLAESTFEKAIYISDSINAINLELENKDWDTQLTGWLNRSGVDIASGGAYDRANRVVDIGSFYNNVNETFQKYYFMAGFKSGYNGYTQWIRNHILVSERLFSFNIDLLQSSAWKEFDLDGVRDDEFAKALALVNYSLGGRAVYDPLVTSIDTAPFYVTLPPSKEIDSFIHKKCVELLKGDPYYNINLNQNYNDPKPKTHDNLVKSNKIDSSNQFGVYSLTFPDN